MLLYRSAAPLILPAVALWLLAGCVPEAGDEGKGLRFLRPGPPMNVQAAPGKTDVVITWSPNVTGVQADHYVIYETQAGGSGAVPVATVLATAPHNFKHQSLMTGSTHFYRVSGVSIFGLEGARSPELSATTNADIPEPPILSTPLTGGDKQITVGWTPGDGLADTFTVYRSISTPVVTASATALPGLAGNSHDDTGLDPGRRYYYVVAGVNEVGGVLHQSPASNESFRSTLADAPAGISATGTAADSVRISWGATPSPQLVTGYEVTREGSVIGTSLSGNSNITESGLVPGTAYSYAVAAINQDGVAGIAVAASDAWTLSDPPATLEAVGGAEQVTLTVTAGATGATGYNIYKSDIGGAIGALLGNRALGAPVEDTGLTPGVTYYYVATSVNPSGEGPGATTPVPATPLAFPVAPSDFRVTGTSVSGQVTLAWNEVPIATGYTLYRSTTPGMGTGGTPVPIASGSTTSHVDAGLTDGTPYHYVIATTNVVGEGPPSPQLTATPNPGITPPSAITFGNLHGNRTLHSGFIVGTATLGDGPGPVIQVSLDGGATFATAVMSGTPPAVTWKFQVAASNPVWPANERRTVVARARDGAGNEVATSLGQVRKGENHDINGDGYPDIAIGAAAVDGEVYIFQSSGALGLSGGAPAIGSSNAHRRIEGEAATGAFGRALALGDVNGDSYADLVVGAPDADGSTGAVYVFHSPGSGGISAVNAADADRKLVGEAALDAFGISVAAGDVNGDGHADVIVGATGGFFPVGGMEGRVYAFHSQGTAGISAAFASRITGDAASDKFGTTVAVGDVNGDGVADVAVGAESHNANAGRAYVFHSAGIAGVPSGGAATIADTVIDGDTTSGFSRVAMGYVDGDDFEDLAIGAPFRDAGQFGAAYLFLSTDATGITATGFAEANNTLIGPSVPAARFGASVSAGDVNGDGFIDLVFGATGEARTYVFHGGSGGLCGGGCSPGTASSANSMLFGEDPGDEFGVSAAVVDVDGNGFSEVIVGARSHNTGDGKAYVYPASASGLGAFPAAAQTIGNDTLPGQAFGAALAP